MSRFCADLTATQAAVVGRFNRNTGNRYYRKAAGKPAFVDGTIHINGIESFWSFAESRLAKVHGTRANFELHLKDCEWRWGKDHDTRVEELNGLLV